MTSVNEASSVSVTYWTGALSELDAIRNAALKAGNPDWHNVASFIADMRREIDGLRSDARVKETLLSDLEEQLAEKDARIEELERERDELNREIHVLQGSPGKGSASWQAGRIVELEAELYAARKRGNAKVDPAPADERVTLYVLRNASGKAGEIYTEKEREEWITSSVPIPRGADWLAIDARVVREGGAA